MCATCGCDSGASVSMHGMHDHIDGHDHSHAGERTHEHHHVNGSKKIIDVEQDVLHQNNLLAQQNRGYFKALNIFSMNLVSSPGSGKTTLLERTLTALKGKLCCYVIEGDQQTANDADRIHATGTPVVQINTGKGCHLDAHMVMHAVEHLNPPQHAVLFIENVGNLVCPAMFDLGESSRVVIASVTEGDDKPLKYPDMFQSAQLCILNKMDLLPYVPFDVEKFIANALKVNPTLEFIEVSALKEEGLITWYDWIQSKIKRPVMVTHG
jgi:hydrogenase nickel incorporation protein HypB